MLSDSSDVLFSDSSDDLSDSSEHLSDSSDGVRRILLVTCLIRLMEFSNSSDCLSDSSDVSVSNYYDDVSDSSVVS